MAELEYLFRHSAIRDAAYLATPALERARIHDLAAQAYGVVVNPDKAEAVTFTAEDRVIVLAED